ncbi:MAG: LysR substrate-binding domain-containing protein [Burkholderiaceae bacterium]
MDLKSLRYFVAVAELGHMTRAAERLGIQQPPLSLQIKGLERELGVVLFRRHPRGVALTEAGHQFQAEAERLLAEVDAMRHRMTRVAQGEEGRLAIGLTSSAAAHRFVPDLLRAFRQAHPRVQLQLQEANADGLTQAVEGRRVHCALLRVPVAQPPGLVFETLLREPVLVAVPHDHPLALECGGKATEKGRGRGAKVGAPMGSVSLGRLCEEGLILVRSPGAPGLYAELLALCRAQGLQPRVVAEVARMMSNLNLVAAGVGVSVVPQSMAGVHGHAIAYLALEGGDTIDAPLTMVTRGDEGHLPARRFIELARQMAAQ